MKKRFNITGSCIPEEHYMVDTSAKISSIFNMIDQGDYFVINRPRQYGKTTTIYMLDNLLKQSPDYFSISTSFEGIGQEGFASAPIFIKEFLHLLAEEFSYLEQDELVTFIESGPIPDSFSNLDSWLTRLVQKIGKKTILMIDEVDKSSNNQLFLDFLGMLRNKYLKRSKKKFSTFHCVILAGVHDVKTLKFKIRPEAEAKLNSPWNIAVDFNVNLAFSPAEIQTMLEDYSKDQQITFDIPLFADKLFYFTSGYPFLVSNLCKIIHEEILPARQERQWLEQDLDKAFQITLKQSNTNFDSLIQNLENNHDLYEYVFKLVMDGADFSFNLDNPLILFGSQYGILKDEQGKVRVHNRVYEQRIYKYMTSKLESSGITPAYHVTASYLDEAGSLDIQKVFLKFQQFMKEQYSQKDREFLERNGRLLFLAFLRPIINGRGFDFEEVQISEERRLDIVVTFDNKKYIIELKIWRGNSYHAEGLKQLCGYLDVQHVETGYLLIFDLRKECPEPGKWETTDMGSKKIVAAWV